MKDALRVRNKSTTYHSSKNELLSTVAANTRIIYPVLGLATSKSN